MNVLCDDFKNIIRDYNIELDKINIKTKEIPNQPAEKYYGNREYKYKITNITNNKLDKRATQCLFRLAEGKGKAMYLLGVNDNGNIKGLSKYELLITLKNILEIFNIVEAKIKTITIYNIESKNVYCVALKIYKEDLDSLDNIYEL